jgi:hypothetical protein
MTTVATNASTIALPTYVKLQVLDGPVMAPPVHSRVYTQNADALPLSRCTILDGHNRTNGLNNTTTLLSCLWFPASAFLYQHPW